jgi:transcriptional regulator with XRE-family HTH domain
MRGGLLVKEARLRAGLTQAGLAERLETTQPVIARWETGASEPAFRTVVEAIRACDLDLRVELVPYDEHDLLNIVHELSLTPAQRVTQLEASLKLVGSARRVGATDDGA